MSERSFRIWLWAIALVGIGLDQTTKYGMFAWLKGHTETRHTARVFQLSSGPGFDLQARHVENKETHALEAQVNAGALFGWLDDFKDYANNGFAVISLLAAAAIVAWSFRASTARDRWLCIALGLILAGTVGNLYDRVVFSGVRDFLDFYWIDAAADVHHWPTFNLADCFLVSGACLLLLQSFGASAASEKQPHASTSAQPTGAR
jgi:lipoprotein signal peptidase